MAYLTVVVPAYNSEAYLERCLDSLLPEIDALEVLVVNDGSTDRTPAIAESYAKRYPAAFRVIHKENGGHGSGVNAGLAAATAPWFKVLDSDDRFDPEGFARLIRLIRELEQSDGAKPDLIITDFYYEIHREVNGRKVVSRELLDYRNVFREEGPVSWSRVKSFRADQLLMLHALCYRTDILNKVKLRLPEKTYYDDQIFVYEPLPHVRRIYYLNTPVYLYYIGRDEQSIKMDNVVKNVDLQIHVTLEMMRRVRLESVRPQRLQRYMYRHFARMIAMCVMPLGQEGSSESKRQINRLWEELERIDPVATAKLKAMPMLQSRRLLAKAGHYLKNEVYNLISDTFVLEKKAP